MIKLDDNLLIELGLGELPKEEKADFLKHMYETLEMRVGTKLAERMSEAQMAEFEQFISGNDEQGAFRWLESNFPDYKDVVAAEFEKLKEEVRPIAGQILAASKAQAADAASQPAQVPGMGPADDQVATQAPQHQQPTQQPAYHQPYPQQPGQPAAQPHPSQQSQYPQQPSQQPQPQYPPQYGQPTQQPQNPPYGHQG